MFMRVLIVAGLTTLLAIPAAAQVPQAKARVAVARVRAQRALQRLEQRVERRLDRAAALGRISGDARTAIQGRLDSLRDEVRHLRQQGRRLTADERHAVRQRVQELLNAIRSAKSR